MEEFQAVVLGSGGVGKSALTLRFMRDEFVDIYDPTIEETFKKHLSIDGQLVSLDVLDTAGAEQFTAISEFYLKGADGFILVFSLTSPQSLNDLEQIYRQVLRVKGLEVKEIPMIVVGTKSDLKGERSVLPSALSKKYSEWQVPFFETSSKKDINVTESFHNLLQQMLRYRKRKPRRSNRSSSSSHRKKGGCHIM